MKVVIHQMTTTTIYNIIQSELIKRGYNEIVDENDNLVFFDEDHQFMTKILSFDDDVSEIVDDLFNGMGLEDKEYDLHFKKTFLYRFINRQINRQTIESFKLEMLSTFLMNQDYINRVYSDLDEYITQKQTNENENEQTNKQVNDGSSTTDNRSAFADLPQSSTNLDVNNTVMQYPSDNTISRNKQTNNSETDGETKGKNKGENRSYQLDELFKTNGLLEQIFNTFDEKCFLQVW